jgi:TonB family protein
VSYFIKIKMRKHIFAGLNRITILVPLMVLFILTSNACFAKRNEPATIETLTTHGLLIHPEYETAPNKFTVWLLAERVNDHTVAGKILLYSIEYKKDLEVDVQQVYLSSLKEEHDTVVAQDEHGRYFAIDPLSGTSLKFDNRRSKIALNFAIAKSCFQRKNYDEAFNVCEDNRQACLKLFGPNDLSPACCEASMAIIRYAQGQSAEALSLYQRAFDSTKKILLVGTKNHLYEKIASAPNNTQWNSKDISTNGADPPKYQVESDCREAIRLADAKDYLGAENNFKQMLNEYNRLPGNKHSSSTASCLLLAALFFDEQTKYQDAAAILSKALDNYLHCGWGEPNYGAYMTDMQNRIKDSWKPPKEKVSKCAIVDYQIFRDGQLGPLKVAQSSGSASFDQAALATIEAMAPFPILPPGSCADAVVQFTFNYNILGKRSIAKNAAVGLNEKYRQQLGNKSILFMMLSNHSEFSGDVIVLAAQDATIVGKSYKMTDSSDGSRGDGTYFYPYRNVTASDLENQNKDGKVLFFPRHSLQWNMIEVTDPNEKATLMRLAQQYSSDPGLPPQN